MLLRTNIDLFKTIKALAGVNDFTTEENADLVAFAERRLSMAYNTSPMWDRYVVASEERLLATIKVSNLSTTLDGYYIKNGETSNAAQSAYADADVYVKSDDATKLIVKTSSTNSDYQDKWVIISSGVTFVYTPITGITTLSSSSIAYSVVQDTTDITSYDSPSSVVYWTSGSIVITNLQEVQVNDVATVLYESLDFPIINSSFISGDNENVIQDFIRIHRTQSFLNRSATEYDFYVDVNGANVLNSSATDGKVFVTYKKPIANQTTGQIITSVDSSGNRTLNASGSEIPSEFFNYTAHGVYADFLRMDGQHDKAAFEEQKADMFLATELERIDIINNNNSLNHKFSTYINTSSR